LAGGGQEHDEEAGWREGGPVRAGVAAAGGACVTAKVEVLVV
jgi:hypothetical protein